MVYRFYFWLLNFLNWTPEVGDAVEGYMDFSVKFIGVVVEDNSESKNFPCYVVKAIVTVSKLREDVTDEVPRLVTIQAGRCRLVSKKFLPASLKS